MARTALETILMVDALGIVTPHRDLCRPLAPLKHLTKRPHLVLSNQNLLRSTRVPCRTPVAYPIFTFRWLAVHALVARGLGIGRGH